MGSVIGNGCIRKGWNSSANFAESQTTAGRTARVSIRSRNNRRNRGTKEKQRGQKPRETSWLGEPRYKRSGERSTIQLIQMERSRRKMTIFRTMFRSGRTNITEKTLFGTT